MELVIIVQQSFLKGVEDGDDIYLIKKWEQHVAMLSICNM